jgi:hypothetical protein
VTGLDKIQKIQKALEDATVGPWTYDPFINGYGVKAGHYHNQIALITENNDREQAKKNANLIANTPEWLSFLLSEHERLYKVLDKIGFYCAGTELHNVSDFVLRVKNGEQV